jgi:hypothetical protein
MFPGYFRWGIIQQQTGNYLEASELFKKALEYATTEQAKSGMYVCVCRATPVCDTKAPCTPHLPVRDVVLDLHERSC